MQIKKKQQHCTFDRFPVIYHLRIQNQSNRAKEAYLALDLWAFKSFETSKYMGKQNLIKIERKLKKIVSSTVFKLYILRITTWSFKANKYA